MKIMAALEHEEFVSVNYGRWAINLFSAVYSSLYFLKCPIWVYWQGSFQ